MDGTDGSEYAALAAKLDELSRVCTRLSKENAELRDQVSRLTGPAPAQNQRRGHLDGPGALGGAVSRRMAGKALGVAAVGTVGAVTLVNAGSGSAQAADGDAIKAGQSTTCESGTELKFDGSSTPGMIFLVNDTTFSGGGSSHPAAVGGWAGGDVSNGVYGFTEVEAGDGVIGQVGFGNSTGNGVHGLAAGSGVVGVLGENSAGTAIAGASDSVDPNATAIVGTITSTAPGALSAAVRGVNNGTHVIGIGVWGSQAGSGWGVYGSVPSGIGVNADGGTGTGVRAFGKTGVQAAGSKTGLSASGPTAVQAHGLGASGRGGVFTGSAAQVQLSPGSGTTHPKSGKRGDLYADKNGRLWFCKKSGTTATWHQIA